MKPTRVFLHCSASPDYRKDEKRYESYGLEQIRRYHMQHNGWDDVGYHFVIKRPGDIQLGRHLDAVGAHVAGHNGDSIGVCYVGTRWPTDEQLHSIVTIYKSLKDRFGIDHTQWFGHHEVNEHKDCPGFPMPLMRAYLQLHGD